MATPPVAFLTPEQYLEIERAAEFRSESLVAPMKPRAAADTSQPIFAFWRLPRAFTPIPTSW